MQWLLSYPLHSFNNNQLLGILTSLITPISLSSHYVAPCINASMQIIKDKDSGNTSR